MKNMYYGFCCFHSPADGSEKTINRLPKKLITKTETVAISFEITMLVFIDTKNLVIAKSNTQASDTTIK